MDSGRPKPKLATQTPVPGREGTGRALSPAFVARQFKPGQSGNPSGNEGTDCGDVIRLARQHSRQAIERHVELVEADDERVAFMAAQAVLDRGYGRPSEAPQLFPAATLRLQNADSGQVR